jgi:hypothetical protein
MHVTPTTVKWQFWCTRLRRLTGGEPTGVVPLSCPKRICHATRSPGIRMTWPSHRSHRRWWCQYDVAVCGAEAPLCQCRRSRVPENAAEAPMMENFKPLQLRGRDGPGLCSMQQDQKHQAAIFLRVLVRVEMSCCARAFQLSTLWWFLHDCCSMEMGMSKTIEAADMSELLPTCYLVSHSSPGTRRLYCFTPLNIRYLQPVNATTPTFSSNYGP